MLFRLRLAHRLLLIYLLSFVSVAVLAYNLIVEKNIAIDFAQKELRGSAYVAVVRDALLAVVQDRLASTSPQNDGMAESRAGLQTQAAALDLAERQFGDDMDTAALAKRLGDLMGQLGARDPEDAATGWALHMQSMRAARQLISRIGDQSNLILDPDLDSYYRMSILVLRLPEFVAAAVDLADTAAAMRPAGVHAGEARAALLLKRGVFAASMAALAADNARALDERADDNLRTAFQRTEGAATYLSMHLPISSGGQGSGNPMLRRLLSATEVYWRQTESELAQLLEERINRFYRRMMIDLGAAALVWLAALALILIIARQMTRPIAQLAAVADRVRYGADYNLRAPASAGGEIGVLIAGFNDMLDRLQHETAREQERVARDHAAAAQRQLVEAMPVVLSVASEVDGRVLYGNADLTRPSWLPGAAAGDPRKVLDRLYPEDRRAFLEAFRASVQVDGFEARLQTDSGEPFWVLISARAVTYQGEPARLEAYAPINDRKRAEATLARHDAVLNAITYAATRMIGAVDWKIAMPEFLSRLGIATEVDRVFLFEIHAAPNGPGQAQSCRFMWAAPGTTPIAHLLDNDPITLEGDTQFAEWFRRRARGETIQVTRSQTRDEAQKLFEDTGTYSMLSVPIVVEGEFWGSLGFDDCRSERIWDDIEVDLLKTATALVAGAIERSRNDQRLRERDNQLIEAQRIAHVGSWELDLRTDQVTWSDEGWRIFGFEAGRSSWTHAENLQRIHPADRQRVADADALAKDCNVQIDMEYRVLRPDGEIRVVHERAESICDETGKPIRLIGTVHDVTEMKATEAKLRQSEERYALAARGADVGLWDWDVAADHAYFSPRLHELLGVGERKLGQKMSAFLDEILLEDRMALEQHLKIRFAQQRRRFEFEFRANPTAEDPRWLVMRGLIVYGESGPVRLVGSLADVTERKRAQEEVVRQRDALHQNEKMAMLGSLLAGVAHELNNPLSVVIGQIVLLQQTVNDPAVVARAERIRNAAERCARIVRTFLSMARQRHADPKPTDMNGVVQMAVELLAYQLRSANIRVDLDLAQDLPKLTADADQIHQVLTNLIVNARQALMTSAAQRRLRITTRFDSASRLVQVAVVDNGPGVPQEIRGRIFEPFFTTKPVGDGTGIGLSLSASIVRAHGGQLTVSETPQGGATFTIVLPLRTGSGTVLDELDWQAIPAGLRVLIIEDDAEIADTLKEILRRHGLLAETVTDGQQGLQRVLATAYDAILSDMRMPVLDGPQFYEALQRERPDLVGRVAFVTGDTLSAEIQSFLGRTGAPRIEKPFLPHDVLRLLSDLLNRRRAGAPESPEGQRMQAG